MANSALLWKKKKKTAVYFCLWIDFHLSLKNVDEQLGSPKVSVRDNRGGYFWKITALPVCVCVLGGSDSEFTGAGITAAESD